MLLEAWGIRGLGISVQGLGSPYNVLLEDWGFRV